MLGSADEAFERTLAVPEGRASSSACRSASFQALKHRAAQMFCEIELSRSAVLAARCGLDEGRRRIAALASARQGQARTTRFSLVGNEAVQMHGGIGMTDEHDIGFFLKRARVAAATSATSRLPSRPLRAL